MSETIVVLDFGSQYSQLIARRIRECRVYSKIMPYYTSAEAIRAENPQGIILSGGPASVYSEHAPKCDPAIFELGIPVLGICYGLQLMIHTLGGEITRGHAREYGKAMLKIVKSGNLFLGLDGDIQVWMSHGDKVAKMPEGGFEILGSSGNTEFCAVHMPERNLYGIQFHPEVVHTPQGKTIIGNFCKNICRCVGDWTMESFIEQQVREIRAQVGSSNVILGLSGGVDSSVAAALIHKAIGKQLNCIFVNNGLLRKNEAERVRNLFGRAFDMKLIYVDATERFLTKLAGVEEPERKRKIIGNEFVQVFDDASAKIEQAEFLAQGTTY
ncbi:MAG: glutamine-hydrolyzing GMP synthase, partial [Victivallis vadensis]